MFAANAMWGLMSPVAKFAMSCGAIGAFAVTELRIVGAAALFWIASFSKSRSASGLHGDGIGKVALLVLNYMLRNVVKMRK